MLFAGYEDIMGSRVVYVYLPVLLGGMILIGFLRCTSYNELVPAMANNNNKSRHIPLVCTV
jgi:predicted transcriptional regulator